MKVILSRKGFDSKAGGHASPILPDGRMVSLPIPSSLDRISYSELRLPNGGTYADVLLDLDAGAKIDGKGAHLDPDLVRGTRTRKTNWRPSLGQIGSAAGHLRNQQVGEGDIFLFYGWFRMSENVAGRLRFAERTQGIHAIFGYLQVGCVIEAHGSTQVPTWLSDHPHCEPRRLERRTNTIYVAADHLRSDRTQPGAGVFCHNPNLVLTKQGCSRSHWNLDEAIFRHLLISYHSENAWRNGYFHSYPRGQEYVVDADARAVEWAYDLIGRTDRWQ